MRLISISDTHNKHKNLEIPKGDFLIHCGDFTEGGTRLETLNFLQWFSKQPHRYKILVAGNHDFFLEKHRNHLKDLIPKNIHYLKDQGITIEGLKIWGSPYTPGNGNWAFNLERGRTIRKKWNLIPHNTDILITHTPPYGILDESKTYKNIGCEELLKQIVDIKPQLHLFGHVHDDFGKKNIGPTLFINSAVMDSKNRLINGISIVEL
ncbi:metallophosphatase domain-containing protein [Zunongwangia pacifica]|uniref:Metallophosphatase domain-containing protein n=1 Tax=Zunongwangia pacifica TaxID=2911062 RepID=A0A9X1ZYI5_9FLAO|nr:metallophosphatase domain-containing protein [Zunongwangia pacifica]MCL6216769.1 metallophosphatase domain-containing protein [Zunongwangia pacifica]